MIRVGDCRDVMRTLDAESVDAIVTDPPYGLSFMGKGWDHAVPGEEFWREALRVAKPGAHLVAFGGTRTFHRLACAIEDAGWELRDSLLRGHMPQAEDCPWLLAWGYGSGFPKSKNIGGGYGTALKPAWEPIVLARKPLAGTVAANAAEFGTGVLNVGACRVEGEVTSNPRVRNAQGFGGNGLVQGETGTGTTSTGRWPANLIHDGSDEVLAAFPQTESGTPCGVKAGGQGNAFGEFAGGIPVTGYGDAGSAARFFYCAKASRADRNDGCEGMPQGMPRGLGEGDNAVGAGRGSLSKPRENIHPTVKPTELMRWLCRLVTPPGGLVLDPFAGSGSTGRGAILEGFRFLGIELSPEYAAIAEARIAAAARRHAAEAADRLEASRQIGMFEAAA